MIDQVSAACVKTTKAWEQNPHDAGLSAWRKLAKSEPNNVFTLKQAAYAFASRYRFGETKELLAQMRRLDPDAAAVSFACGEVLHRIGLPTQAAEEYAKAAACPEATPIMRVAAAAQFERAHEIDRAIEVLGDAQKHEPRALLIRARLHRRAKEPDQAESLLQELIGKATNDPDLQAEAYGELTILLDKHGEYDRAFEAIGKGKAIQLSRSQNEQAASNHVSHRFAALIDGMTADDANRWFASEPPDDGRPRNALLTGFPRSGTTLLEQVLDAHPSIVTSEERDVLGASVFPAAHHGLDHHAPVEQLFDRLTPDQLAQHRAFYWQAMRYLGGGELNGSVHIDKNPASNLLIPFFLRLFPGARLIIALRDPRDVVLSCYLRFLRVTPISVAFLSLEATVQRYVLDMTVWLKLSEILETPWVETRYEDTVADLEGQARKVIEALGLPWRDEVLAYNQKLKDKVVKSPSYEQVSKPIYSSSIGRWKHYEKHLEPVLDRLEPFLKAFEYTS